VFLAYIFKHSDRSYLLFLSHFKNVSVYYCKKQLMLMICLFGILYQHCF